MSLKTHPMLNEIKSEEAERQQLLMDAGLLCIFWVADNGIPMPSESFKRHTLEIANRIGVPTERLVAVYQFLQRESSTLSFKSDSKKGIGFKSGEHT